MRRIISKRRDIKDLEGVPFRHRLWRATMTVFHRSPIHPGWKRPLTFYEGEGACILCRWTWRRMRKHLPDLRDALADRSRVTLSEPEYVDGKLVKAGIVMSATVKRQLDEIMSDPEAAKALQEVFEEIARDPEP